MPGPCQLTFDEGELQVIYATHPVLKNNNKTQILDSSWERAVPLLGRVGEIVKCGEVVSTNEAIGLLDIDAEARGLFSIDP